MKREILQSISFLFIAINSFAQIDVREEKKQTFREIIESKLGKRTYDSTSNLPELNVEGFVGQRLLMNVNETKGFYSTIGDTLSVYKGVVKSKHTEPETPIEALKGKFFEIIDYEITKGKYGDDYFNLYFKMKDENNETLFFRYIENQPTFIRKPDYTFPFITEGFYKKCTQLFKNKKVIYSEVLSGIYYCSDVFVKEGMSMVSFTLQNQNDTLTIELDEYPYQLKPIKDLNFKVDDKYLGKSFSKISGKTAKGSLGLIDISHSRSRLLLIFMWDKNLCFDTDDLIKFQFQNSQVRTEYYRGKFNCKGSVYVELDISIDYQLELLEYLANNKILKITVQGDNTDSIILNDPNGNFSNAIKAHYNALIEMK